MITNILLGAILGTILGVFLILNSKINRICDNIKIILLDLIDIYNNINVNNTNNKLLINLTDRFNDKILKDDKRFNVLIDEFNYIKSKINALFHYCQGIGAKISDIRNILENDSSLDDFNVELEKFILNEHNNTRNEIKK